MNLKITDALEEREPDVFNFIKQTIAVTMLNLRTIPQRLGSSGVAIVGIAGVVIVLVSVLSIAQGFAAAMEASGSPVRALVMRSGADSEMTSGLGGAEVDIIKQAPGLRRDGQTGVASAELYVIIDIPKISHQHRAPTCRCAASSRTATTVRDEFSIVEGRMFEFGTNEVVVGRGASGQLPGPHGRQHDSVRAEHAGRWSACSRPTAASPKPKSGATRACCRARIAAATRYQTVLARLDSSESFNTFRDWLTANPQVNVQVRREDEYYAQQSRALTSLIRRRSASASPR